MEPKWNQTFIYSPVHRREFRERMLEITLWDQARVREEESEFLGEVSDIILKLRLYMSSVCVCVCKHLEYSVCKFENNQWKFRKNELSSFAYLPLLNSDFHYIAVLMCLSTLSCLHMTLKENKKCYLLLWTDFLCKFIKYSYYKMFHFKNPFFSFLFWILSSLNTEF